MEINVEKFIEQANANYLEIKKNRIDNFDWEIYSAKSRYTVKYGKNFTEKVGRDMFSGSILNHLRQGKVVRYRLFDTIPAKANKEDYTKYYFDGDTLVMSEFVIPDYPSFVTFYFNEDNERYLISFFVRTRPDGTFTSEFSSVEKSLFSDDKVVRSEFFEMNFQIPYGVSKNIEYYEYDGEKLIQALLYNDYNKNYTPNKIVADLLLNPTVYIYDFEYDADSVFCVETRRYKAGEDRTRRFEITEENRKKLSKNGFNCFGNK